MNSLRSEIDQLNKQNVDSRQQLKRLETQMESSKEQKQKLEDEKKKVEEERDAAIQKLEQLKRDFETYKSTYKVSMQKRAPGMQIEDFTAVDGKDYRNIVLRELTDTYVNFVHDAGVIKLTAAELPEKVQALLGLLNKRIELVDESLVAQTPRQINAQRKVDYGLKLKEMDDRLKALRRERELANKDLGRARQKLRELKFDEQPISEQQKVIDDLDFKVKKIANQILQVEVERHEIYKRTPVLLPER